VENYGKDSLIRVIICYTMNSYLRPYCEEEANYSQYSVNFNVLNSIKNNAEIIFFPIFPYFRRTISFQGSSVSSICSRRRNAMNTEISTDCNSDGISLIDDERNSWRNPIQVPYSPPRISLELARDQTRTYMTKYI